MDDSPQKTIAKMLKKTEEYYLPKPLFKASEHYAKEADLLRAVKAYLESQDHPIFYQRCEGQGKMYRGKFIASEMTGFPDLIIIEFGVTFGVELKVPGGHLSEHQAKKLLELQDKGKVTAGVVFSVQGLIEMLNARQHSREIITKHGNVRAWL